MRPGFTTLEVVAGWHFLERVAGAGSVSLADASSVPNASGDPGRRPRVFARVADGRCDASLSTGCAVR